MKARKPRSRPGPTSAVLKELWLNARAQRNGAVVAVVVEVPGSVSLGKKF